MDLQKLFYTVAARGYTYMDGRIKGFSAADNMISFDFSTGYNGRGDAIEVEISDPNKCTIRFFYSHYKQLPKQEFTGLQFDELVPLIIKTLNENIH